MSRAAAAYARHKVDVVARRVAEINHHQTQGDIMASRISKDRTAAKARAAKKEGEQPPETLGLTRLQMIAYLRSHGTTEGLTRKTAVDLRQMVADEEARASVEGWPRNEDSHVSGPPIPIVEAELLPEPGTPTNERTRRPHSSQTVVFVVDGKPQKPSVSRLLDVAWHHTAGIYPDRPRITTRELRDLLAQAGIDDPETTEWQMALPNGKTVIAERVAS